MRLNRKKREAILSDRAVFEAGGQQMGRWDYDQFNQVRAMRASAPDRPAPAEMRASSVTSTDTAYFTIYPPNEDADSDAQIQMAANNVSSTLFLGADDFSILDAHSVNGHASIRVPASVATAGDIWAVDASYGAMSTESAVTAATIFGGDVDSNIAARSGANFNIRGFEIKFTVNASATVMEYSGNWVGTHTPILGVRKRAAKVECLGCRRREEVCRWHLDAEDPSVFTWACPCGTTTTFCYHNDPPANEEKWEMVCQVGEALGLVQRHIRKPTRPRHVPRMR